MEPINDSNIHELKPEKESLLEISKWQGLFLSLVIVSAYTIIRWWIFTQHGHYLTLIYISVILFFFGVAFGLLEIIEPGTTDTLVFFGRLLKKKWKNGYVLVPSPVPFMHRLRFRPLFSLLKKHWREVKVNEDSAEVFRHDVNFDGANQQRINVNATLLEATVFQGGKISLKWFFSMNGDSPYAFQEFGLKLIIVAVLLDCFNLGTAGVVNLFSSNPKNEIVAMESQNEIKSSQNQIVLAPVFPMGKNNSNQSECNNTETNWDVNLVYEKYFEMSKVGCLNFHPPFNKAIGIMFERVPSKIDGDFSIRLQNKGDACFFNSSNDCLNFIESHLNEVLIFKGDHIYLSD